MSKIGNYQPAIGKYKDYLSHPFYEEKVQTLQEQVYGKLKKIAKLLSSLYPKLTDDFGGNVKVVIEKNLNALIHDLDLMQSNWEKDPFSFNTSKLKTNEHCIAEMKNICNTLQTVRIYEGEFKNLSKIKHALHELEHLIQPTSFERSLQKTQIRSQPIKKERLHVGVKKKIKEKSVEPKRKKAILKKAKTKTKSPVKAKKTVTAKSKISGKSAQRSRTATPKLKQAVKKVVKKSPVKAKPKISNKSAQRSRTATPKLKQAVKKVVKTKSPIKAKKMVRVKPKISSKSAQRSRAAAPKFKQTAKKAVKKSLKKPKKT